MLYVPIPEVYWFSLGGLIDDLPDIPRRYRKLFFPTLKGFSNA